MKYFDPWNEKKKEIEQSSVKIFYHPREIWWCSLGLNVGREQDGGEKYMRPVLILKGFSPDTCLIIPLTSSKNKHSFRISVGNIGGTDSSVILSQMRTIDTKRLFKKIQMLENEIFELIRNAIKHMF